ncbi:MAG TPA: HD domain-containing phosphohydrolase [Myxococcota bacterium]|nr:HD domain-containing phosphohydrolase [Myxococcota bacterium]
MVERTRETILVVDDERGPRESLRMILSPLHRVLTASSALDALAILRRERVEIVTVDLNMQGMNGQDLVRRVHEEFPDTEIVVITGCATVESAAESVRIGICDYLEKPFDVVKVGAAIARAAARRRARGGLRSFLEELGAVVGREQDAAAIVHEVERSQKLRGRLSDLLAGRGDERAARAEAEELRTIDFLEVLAETIETKGDFMRGHARRVSFYAGLLAERVGVFGKEQEQVRIAAFLHDLGKVGIPGELLLREGALDPSERKIMEQHPVIGARLVRPLLLQSDLTLAIQHHHEWWDGTGYPDGLSGLDIPINARIVAVADAFDAMSCDRPYRRALRREVVLGEFRRFAGVQFDPNLAKEFAALVESSAEDVDITVLAGAGEAAQAG